MNAAQYSGDEYILSERSSNCAWRNASRFVFPLR